MMIESFGRIKCPNGHQSQKKRGIKHAYMTQKMMGKTMKSEQLPFPHETYRLPVEYMENLVKHHIMFNSDKSLVGVEKQDGS